MQVDVLEAETDLSKLIRILESGREKAITVTRNGKPVVKITLVDQPDVSKRIGIAKGKWNFPENWEEQDKALDAEIAKDFYADSP